MLAMTRTDLGLMMEAGYVFVGMQRFKEAREVFEGIAVLAPESELPIVAIASVDFCQGRFAEACRRYRKAIKRNPESAYAHAYLGEALFFLGRREEATRELEWTISHDAEGKAAAFAQALLDAVRQGFTPAMLAGVEDLKAYRARLPQEKGHA